MKQINHQSCNHEHPTIMQELVCHLPYSIVAVAFSLAMLSFLSLAALWSNIDPKIAKKGVKMLFHSFHFMHIVFAATGTLVSFFRFSQDTKKAILIGFISPSFFCVLSDAIIPYIAGIALGFDMHFHICFWHELKNVLPFLLVGIATGFLTKWGHANTKTHYALTSHTSHILVSSLASSCYLVANGLTNWHSKIGFVFFFLIIAVVVPCTLADVIVPMIIARLGNSNEKSSAS